MVRQATRVFCLPGAVIPGAPPPAASLASSSPQAAAVNADLASLATAVRSADPLSPLLEAKPVLAETIPSQSHNADDDWTVFVPVAPVPASPIPSKEEDTVRMVAALAASKRQQAARRLRFWR